MKRQEGVFDPDILAIVKELVTYRQVMGISVNELSKRMNVGNMVLARWEKEIRVPEMVNLRLWAETLGYKIKLTIEL
jgi:transcriptional regulator with XRE-family HTH domain